MKKGIKIEKYCLIRFKNAADLLTSLTSLKSLLSLSSSTLSALLFLTLLILPLDARDVVPWGRDVGLIEAGARLKQGGLDESVPCHPERSLLQRAAIQAIWFHKKVISPADGPRSHFRPNSSQYTIDAIEKYGFWKGYLLGCDRLMRENSESWIYRTIVIDNDWITKWDPVR